MPVGSAVALPLLFHLFLLLALANNHARLLFVFVRHTAHSSTTRDAVIFDAWPWALWYIVLYAGLHSTSATA